MVLKSKRRKLRSGVEEEEERRKKESIMKTSECWVALKAENIFTAQPPENFSFDYFLRLSRRFRLCVLSPFFRKQRSLLHQKGVDTDTQDRNKEKRRPFFKEDF